jgi:hypothetical protein
MPFYRFLLKSSKLGFCEVSPSAYYYASQYFLNTNKVLFDIFFIFIFFKEKNMIVFSWQEMPITLSRDGSNVIGWSESTIITTEPKPIARAVLGQAATVVSESDAAVVSESVATVAPELADAVAPKPMVAAAPEPPPTTIAPKIASTNRPTSHAATHVTNESPTPENPPWPPFRAN